MCDAVSYTLADWTKHIPESEIRRILRYNPKFYFGGGKPGALPLEAFREILQRITNELKKSPSIGSHFLLDYGQTEGLPDLCKVLAERLRTRDGVPLDSEDGWKDVIITSGSQQTLYALLDVFIRPKDLILVTRPSYLGFVTPAVKLGAELVSLPTDKDGILPEAVETACRECERLLGRTPKMLYVVPFSDNPKGTTLPESRKRELFALAEQWDFLIAEDVAYKEIRYGTDLPPLHPIKELDKDNERVAYLSTTTKEAASLRLGYSVYPSCIREEIIKAKGYLDLCSPSLTQEVARLYYGKYIDEWLPRVLKVYEERRDAMVEAVDTFLPPGEYIYPKGGFFVWYELEKDNFDAKKFLDRIIEEVQFVPGYAFYPLNGQAVDDSCSRLGPRISRRNTMRLGYSLADPETIRQGIPYLGRLLNQELAKL
ncbi:MAG: aminotransferase-like domain-containing protein [Candidatus Hodarchaeales archaeon]|jgi:2-aminoadipate transaminase